jgi:cell division protein FtsI (penicillin-binding protein 3)
LAPLAKLYGDLRRRVLLLGLVVAGLVVSVRAFQLSVLDHSTWQLKAEKQHADTLSVPAPRGTIYDRDGVPLASTREMWMVALAPREVIDALAVERALREHLGFSAREARRLLADGRSWVPLPGRYETSVRVALDRIEGVHFERAMMRFYPHGAMAAELLGRVNASGEVRGGLELELDTVLAGRAGLAVVRVNPRGRPVPGVMLRAIEPVSGQDVVLTIDADLQEIAQEALADALETTLAEAGEMLIADPRTGEILAAVSRRADGTASSWAAVTSPYEPGSTIKPFTLASLLADGLAELTDSLYGEDGSYRLNGRTITDVHGHGWLTLREGFLVSSNVIMAKAASRMEPATQYRRLRDFGFGTATGIPYPAESSGLLRHPKKWSRQSTASLAFGYELSVTPLQLVMAYASIANGGILMEPRIVREIRTRDGRVLQRQDPRAVRRVIPREVADQVRNVMIDAVDTGTGRAASMGAFKVAGKTGTARLVMGGRYQPGAYIATFAGFFPADDPQLVFLVKLDRPRGDYYGGLTAAPVTKATLQAALAAKGTPFDRSAVAQKSASGFASVPPAPEPGVWDAPIRVTSFTTFAAVREEADEVVGRANAAARDDGARDHPTDGAMPESGGESPLARPGQAMIPDVVGLPLREAARRLHVAGFRVRMEGSGRVRAVTPAPGSAPARGTVVRVMAGGRP